MANRNALLLGFAALAATPAAAQLRTERPDVIAAAAVDCWQAMSATGVDESKLASGGWQSGNIVKDGKTVATPLHVLGKPGGTVTLLVMTDKAAPSCSVLSKIGKASDVSDVAGHLMTGLKAVEADLKIGKKDGSYLFLAGSRIAQLEASGTNDKPAARIIVAYTSSEKK